MGFGAINLDVTELALLALDEEISAENLLDFIARNDASSNLCSRLL